MADWDINARQEDHQPISNQYKFGHIVSEIENIFGRQSSAYISN